MRIFPAKTPWLLLSCIRRPVSSTPIDIKPLKVPSVSSSWSRPPRDVILYIDPSVNSNLSFSSFIWYPSFVFQQAFVNVLQFFHNFQLLLLSAPRQSSRLFECFHI